MPDLSVKMNTPGIDSFTDNAILKDWVKQIAHLCQPKEICFVEGTKEEYDALIKKQLATNTLIELNQKIRPGCYLARSNPDDVARVEDRTFICSKTQEDAGPTNNWMDPEKMHALLLPLFEGCMHGRTMYVVPFCMGPIDSPSSRVGVEITDSPYVVSNLFIMTRVGRPALSMLGLDSFVKCLHSVGVPLLSGQKDLSWPCNPKNTYIVHYPELKQVWSFGSGYGGNALLNKKCFALRIASKVAKEEGWLAEHMLIVGVTNPKGEKKYFAASFPSACGKTNLAMLNPAIPGWKIECVGDDIAWMHWGKDGRLYAINPEAGFFGVAPGTSFKSNPNAMKTIQKNTLFTNVALTDDGDVWWEQMTDTPPSHLINWLGEDWTPESTQKAAHPNSRFTAPCVQSPCIDPGFDAKEGVPISGIIFGGRRSTCIPLVREAANWQQGVFFAASMSSETTAAAKGDVGKLRHDPFAMLPFCGYNMADYFAHWLEQSQNPAHILPKIYSVNWFKKSEDGTFLWPGFGENIRVLKWCFERCQNAATSSKTAVGLLPKLSEFDFDGLGLSDTAKDELFAIKKSEWLGEAENLESYFAIFGKRMPQPLIQEVQNLKKAMAN